MNILHIYSTTPDLGGFCPLHFVADGIPWRATQSIGFFHAGKIDFGSRWNLLARVNISLCRRM
jgi:hypothetical protein